MAWLPTATYSAPGVPLYGQGGSPNLDLSTLVLEAGGTSTILECFPSTGRLQTISGTDVIEVSLSAVLGGVSIVDANGTETLFAGDRVVTSSISTLAIAGNLGFFETLSTTVFEADQIYNSTISTSQIDIDGQTLNATPTELLLNGIPLATTSNLSSIADWALDPAISTVQMLGNDLIDARNIFGQNLSVSSIFASSITALNAYHTSTYTSTISSLIEVADAAYFSSVSSGNIQAGVFGVSSLSSGFITADQISTNSLFVSSINGSEITTSSITISSMVTQAISSVFLQASSISGTFVSTLGAEIRQGLMSSIVFSPSLNPSLGGVNVNLGLGGILGNVIGWGAGVLGAATGIVALGTSIAALAMGRQTTYIDNTKYELVNGTTQLQFSSLGTSFSTIYRFNNSPDPERVPGEEVFISTIYAPQLAVRSVSDPIYTLSTPNSTIQSFGQWVPVPEELLTSSFSTLAVANLTANRITTSSIVGGEASLLTIGAPLIHLSTAAVGGLVFTDGEMDALRFESREVWTSSIITSSIQTSSIQAWDMQIQDITAAQVSTANVNAYNITSYDISTAVVLGANPGAYSLELRARPGGTFYLNGQGATIAGATVTSSLNADGVIGNAGYLGVVSTGLILGANSNLFGLGLQGLELRTDPTGQIWVSSPQTNIAGFINSSTIGANRMTSRVAEFSTLNMTGLSTVTLSTLGTAGAQSQPAGRLFVTGNDVDFGQQDIWCQQIRLGAGNATNAQTEIIFYDANANQRGLQTALLDRTIRVVSTINANQGGYMLDTGINPPFFSTLANTSTALMAFFPSTVNSTIGASTLSVMPQINFFGSWYSSTSQTVVGANTETALSYNSEGMNVGGFTYAGSTITVPVSGRYEITHSIQFDTTSGGTNNVNFWLKKNGVNLPQSASIVSIVNNGETLGTISLFDTAAANDQYAVSIYSADANMTAVASAAAGAVPAIPSIITNIKRLG